MKKLLFTLLIAGMAWGGNQLTDFLDQGTVSSAQTHIEQPKHHSRPEAASKQQSRVKGLEIPAYLTDRSEEIVAHTAYTVSFNHKHKIPNWVGWVLTPERVTGDIPRADRFEPDPNLRKGTSAQWSDYKNSGYDRGHICPAADNKHSREAMNESFYMSNICPQTHRLNAGDWKDLENKCRHWARQYKQIYIVGGPIIPKGEKLPRLTQGGISIPPAFFKVILRTTKQGYTAIAFVMPQNAENKPLTHYACTVDHVEDITGINFFTQLPKEIEQKVEAAYQVKDWNGLR